MRVNIRCPIGKFGSLPYLAELMTSIFYSKFRIKAEVSGEYKAGYHNILIDEGVSSVIKKRKAEVWWTDTPAMLPLSYHKLETDGLFSKHYTVSEFNRKHYLELGIEVDDIIPRPINPIHFHYSVDYDKCNFDLITIGKKCMCDRKNLKIQRDIVLSNRIKFCAITDAYIPNRDYITQYNFGSLTDEQKAKLLSKSRFFLWTSFAEGFGLPPLEAMAVGCVPIYTDVPAHNEFCIGIKIPSKGMFKSACYGTRIYKWIIDKKDVEETVKYALSLSKEEWQNLSELCKEKAVEMWNEFIDKVGLLLEG